MTPRSTLPVAALAALAILGTAGAQVVMTAQAEERAVQSGETESGEAGFATRGQRQAGCLQRADEDDESGEGGEDDGASCQSGPISQTGKAPANGLFQPGSAPKANTN